MKHTKKKNLSRYHPVTAVSCTQKEGLQNVLWIVLFWDKKMEVMEKDEGEG